MSYRPFTKLMAALVTAASLATVSVPSHALTDSGSFDVTVNLYPKCTLGTISSALTLNYVSFQASDSTNTQSVNVTCTNSLPYTLSFGGTSGSSGTVVGLNYTLSTLDPSNAAVTTGTGTGAAQAWKIQGTIASGQSGTCGTSNTATSGSQVASVTGTSTGNGTACSGTSASGAHSLIITY